MLCCTLSILLYLYLYSAIYIIDIKIVYTSRCVRVILAQGRMIEIAEPCVFVAA